MSCVRFEVLTNTKIKLGKLIFYGYGKVLYYTIINMIITDY